MANNNMEGLEFFETGLSLFSNPSFIWRKINIGPQDIRDGTNESGVRGGALHYQGSSQISSACRNRSILWRHGNHSIHLLELSLDHDLVNNAIHINLSSSYGVILGDITIHELSSHIIILFQTPLYVFRLVLPHPDIVAKDAKLSAAGKGLHPSILTFATDSSFTGTNMVIAFPSADQTPQGITSSCSWIGMDGVAMFIYGLTSSNGLHCVQLPTLGATGIPERFELNDKSVVSKFWNLLPAGIRGSDDGGFIPVGITVHSFGGELILLVLCKNGTMKLWSVKQRECVLELSLIHYLSNNASIDDAKLSIHKAQTTSNDCIKFCVYFGLSSTPQLSVFQLILIDSQLVLDLVTSHILQLDHFFIDVCLGNDIWWMVCTTDQSTVITYCHYTDRLNPSVKSCKVKSLPLSDVVVGEANDPRESYLDAIFAVDKFSPEAVSRALKLYGHPSNRTLSVEKLREEVIIKIEDEITTAAMSCELSHDDYRELVTKCWNKFYTCCLQYEKLTRTPVGVTCDHGTGMVAMIQQGTVSFLHPKRASSDSINSNILNEARQFLHHHLSSDVFEVFMNELCYNDPLSLVNDLIKQLIYDNNQSDEFVPGLVRILSETTPTTFGDLIQTLSPINDDNDDHMTSDDEGMSGPDMVIADLYASSISMKLMGGAIGDVSHDRIEACLDMLIILTVIKRHSINCTISISELSDLILKFNDLLINYSIINWLCTTVTTPTNQSTIDANLKMMSNLKITENFPLIYSMSRNAPMTTLMEMFISTCGRGLIMRKLLESSPFKPDVPVYSYWRNMLPWILDELIKNSWPEDIHITLYQSLLTEGHYLLLQVLHSRLLALESVDNGHLSMNSRDFLLGQSYIGTGENMKAVERFVKASDGVDIEPLLLRVAENDGGYWTVCMRLLEEAGAVEGVVQLLEHATSVLIEKDEVLPLLWSNLFKYSLELELHHKAYYAMINNPDSERCRECLKHFVVVLTKRRLIKELCTYTYCGMEEEVEHVMELRARSVEVFDDHCYYDLMYCYYISREKYWKAAHVMYEYGLRSGLEGKSTVHLQKECNCYAACITCLKLVKPKYHWIVLPVEQSQSQKTKEVRILKLNDIEVKFSLMQSKLILLKRFPSLSSQLCNPYVTCEETQALLCQNGLFDEALRLSLNCNLSLVPVYESLAGKCAVLSLNTLYLSDDHSMWEWLSFNDQYSDSAEARSSSIVDQAWNMLHTYLLKYSNDYKLLKCVIRKLLSLGCSLPQWLIDLVKLTNPDGLLRLYLHYNHLPQAIELVMEYIDAVMGRGTQYFGIKNALHATSPPVWLPYTAIDQLMNVLDQYNDEDDSSLNELKDNLHTKLDEYSNMLEQICTQSKQVSLLL